MKSRKKLVMFLVLLATIFLVACGNSKERQVHEKEVLIASIDDETVFFETVIETDYTYFYETKYTGFAIGIIRVSTVDELPSNLYKNIYDVYDDHYYFLSVVPYRNSNTKIRINQTTTTSVITNYNKSENLIWVTTSVDVNYSFSAEHDYIVEELSAFDLHDESFSDWFDNLSDEQRREYFPNSYAFYDSIINKTDDAWLLSRYGYVDSYNFDVEYYFATKITVLDKKSIDWKGNN